jgi:hypothetical protein
MNQIFLKNQGIRRVAFFFPIQLLLVHLKKNHLLLLFWIIMFGFVTKVIAPKYGIPLLFLNPEYLDNVSIWSYFIVGFSCGGFIMAFNMSSYIMNGFRFPFIATLTNPFLKYCLNNSIIPIVFLLTYTWHIYDFQVDNGLRHSEIFMQIFSFLFGCFFFIFLSITYFFSRSKDIFKMFGLKEDEGETRLADVSKKESRDWYVETYLASFTSVRLARKYDHYEKEMLHTVFRQNHYAAATFEIITIVSLLILGFFREVKAINIPAGASVFLLFTMFLMLGSALHSYLRGWSTTAFIALLLLVNALFRMETFNARNKAYGLNYDGAKSEFNYQTLKGYDNNHVLKEQDMNNTISILNNWLAKNTEKSETNEKPKLVLFNTSGGGLRSTMWTSYVLQYADKMLEGKLMDHIMLMTGSSGGMVGAAYMRELYLLKQQHKINDFYHDSVINNISKDLLNPIAFSVASNDLFVRLQHFKDGNNSYTKDRAYAFENKLNDNTSGILKKRLIDYRRPEQEALIPMMILTPTIINDGRKLMIASQPISYLSQNKQSENLRRVPLISSIEFTRFFAAQDAYNLRFTSALRMNATFPFIMPVVALPSEPTIEVMDAGIRDNYGVETSLRFLNTFKDWISKNTSGVVIIQVRDRHKEFPIEDNPLTSVTGSLTRPLGSFYGNTFSIQDYNQNQLVEYASQWYNGKIDVIDFQLRNEIHDNISLSWHLTNHEKKKVLSSIDLAENQAAIQKLKRLFANQ